MRPRTRQLELRRLFSHHLLHVFSTLSLAANSWSICSSIRPEPHPSSSSHTPLSLHDIVLLSLSPLPTALLRSTDQCSPLVTILACLTRTAPSTLSKVRTVPYLTLHDSETECRRPPLPPALPLPSRPPRSRSIKTD
jgi:hypothetical protein